MGTVCAHIDLPYTVNTGMTNWHDNHLENRSLSEWFADEIASFIGSWKFVLIQTGIFILWVIFNTLALFGAWHFDPYPFILFNLFMSAEAAYATPLIMMAQNRQAERDRAQAEADYQTNVTAKEEIEALQIAIARIETENLMVLDQKIDALHEKIGNEVAG